MKHITLSPSDLSYFYKDSPKGFYEKYVLNIKRPRMPFPNIFNVIDVEMKNAFTHKTKTLNELDDQFPDGFLSNADAWVESKPIIFKKHDLAITLRGKIDSFLNLKDGTGGVIDFKATTLNDKLIDLYSPQLHSYAYALEHPLDPKAIPINITTLGLIVYQPQKFIFRASKSSGLSGLVKWVDIPFDKKGFLLFLKNKIVPLLTLPEPPEAVFKDDKMWEKYILNFGIEENNLEIPEELLLQ